MKPNHNSKNEAAARKLTAKAKSILRKTDGLKVLKAGTVGYTIALSAVKNALREAVPAALAAPAQPAPVVPAVVDEAVLDSGDAPQPITDDSPELRMVKFIERFDEKLVAAGFTHSQRHVIVGALWTNSTTGISTDKPRQIGMRDITVAILEPVTNDSSEEVFQALSAACGRVRRILGTVTLAPGHEAMMTCPTCEGKQRLGPNEWCTRCDRSGVIPAHTNALAEMVIAGMKPYAWENGLTGEFTKDDDKGFIWELNKDNVTRLYSLPTPDNAPWGG
jgi:hypothetical protein